MSKQKVINGVKVDNFWDRNRKSEGYLLKKKLKEIFIHIVRFILLFGMCFLILQPILNKISISLMEEKDLYNPTVIAIPENFTNANYVLASNFMRYWSTLRTTVIISVAIAVLQISICTLVGYGFARFEFPLKKFWFGCVILLIVIPPQLISTPLFLHFINFDILGIISLFNGGKGINLRATPVPYFVLSATCMGLKNGLYIFMIRQFFRNIPKEIEEAAYIDGCGTLKTFVRIMLPDAKPILTSCFLFAFVWQWTDGFYTNMFLGKLKLLSVQLLQVAEKLGNYMTYTLKVGAPSHGYMECILSTATLMVIAPILLLYLFAQKGFVESISSSGIKM